MTIETPALSLDALWTQVGGVGFQDARPTVFNGPGVTRVGLWGYSGLTRPQRANGPVDPLTGDLTVETGRPNTLRYVSGTFTVHISTWATDAAPCTLELYAVRATAPSAWSTPGNAPPTRDLTTLISNPQLEAELNAANVVRLAARFFAAVPARPVVFTFDLGALHSVAHNIGWDGNLNLFMLGLLPTTATPIVFQDVGTDANGAVLTLDVDTVDLTGLQTERHGWLGRARRCPRCGRPRVSDDFVRDGETHVYVCADCYDIRQRPHKVGRGEKPPINEG